MDYGFEYHRQVFTPNATRGITPADNTARNAALTRENLRVWQDRPVRFVAYYTLAPDITPAWAGIGMRRDGRTISGDPANRVTTWTGEILGQIVAVTFYRHNFGGRFVAITVHGTNGAEYHGRASWDGGSVITLRRKGVR